MQLHQDLSDRYQHPLLSAKVLSLVSISKLQVCVIAAACMHALQKMLALQYLCVLCCFSGLRLQCLSDNNCSGPMMNFTTHRIDCCEGFATARSDSRIQHWVRYRHHHFNRHRSFILRNAGCTVGNCNFSL